jgi:hypothetical protein
LNHWGERVERQKALLVEDNPAGSPFDAGDAGPRRMSKEDGICALGVISY